jgi:hypothetical protein
VVSESGLKGGFRKWFRKVVLQSGFGKWFRTVVSYSGFGKWFRKVILESGFGKLVLEGGFRRCSGLGSCRNLEWSVGSWKSLRGSGRTSGLTLVCLHQFAYTSLLITYTSLLTSVCLHQ